MVDSMVRSVSASEDGAVVVCEERESERYRKARAAVALSREHRHIDAVNILCGDVGDEGEGAEALAVALDGRLATTFVARAVFSVCGVVALADVFPEEMVEMVRRRQERHLEGHAATIGEVRLPGRLSGSYWTIAGEVMVMN